MYGIPCKHKIIPILQRGGQLDPEMFDRHWWLKRDITEEELRRTRILEPKVKPRKKKQKTGLRIPSGFEFADLNHPASRHPQVFPDPLPPQLPSRNNPTPSIPASQPLMQDRTQCRLEASQQRQTAQVLSAANPPATVQTTNMSVSSTTHTNFQHLRPLEPRPIQATQPAPFHQATPAFVQYIQNYPPHSNYQYLRPLEPATQATHWQPTPFQHQAIEASARNIQHCPLPAQAQYYPQHLSNISTPAPPQNSDFVTPFLPGRSHNYTAYTCEDSTSSQRQLMISSCKGRAA